MDAIPTMPRGEFCSALDAAVKREAAAHHAALETAEHAIFCPKCRRRGNTECPECFGTAILPATQEQWELNELGEIADALQEHCLDRFEKLDRWKDLRGDMRTLHSLLMLEWQKAGGKRQ